MKPYDEILNQIPKEAWQYVTADYQEAENGEGLIKFFWDEDAHPELKPLSELDKEQWHDLVITSLQRAIDHHEDQGATELGNRNDGSSGELAGESDS